ncbi:hypothetical protein J4E91_001456 [Alternaria rosae]|nr:hypothetical protein J4E91_001456 [Alternaria rosae]
MAYLDIESFMTFSLVSLAFFLQVASSSRIATFTDSQCKNAFQSLDAENGYISSSSRSATPSASPSTSPSSTPSPSVASKPRKSNTGAIAGGVVGGVCGLALIAAAVLLLLRRKKKAEQPPEISADERGEVDGRGAFAEMPHQDPKQEMDSKNIAPQELGDKKSVDLPPVELPGDDAARHSQHIPDSQLTGSEKH